MPTEEHNSDRPHQGVPQSVLALMPPLKVLAPTLGVALLVWGLLFVYISSPAWAETITVNSTADPGADDAECTLREAITSANTDTASGGCVTGSGADTITFALPDPSTISLNGGELLIADDLEISGPGASALTISGNDASRVFFVNPGPPSTGPSVAISNLTIANGLAKGGNGGGPGGGGAAGMGGAIFVNNGSVTISGVAFSGNRAQGGNGGAGGEVYFGGGGGGSIGGNGEDGDFEGGAGGAGGPLGGNGGAGGADGTSLPEGSPGGNGGPGGAGGAGGSFGGAGGEGGFLSGGAGGGGAGLGGAIFIRAGSLTLADSSFTDNAASGGTGANNGQGKGGAIFVLSPATVSGCATFSGNSATDAAGSGTDTNDTYGGSVPACDTTPPTVTVDRGGACKPTSADPRGTINLALLDPDDPPENLTLSATSSNQSVLTDGNISFAGGTDASRTLSVSALAGSGSSTVTVEVSDGDVDGQPIQIEVMVGTNARDTLTGSANSEMIFARRGGDTASGLGENDLLCGANGKDALLGGEGDDTLGGGNNDDTLSGGGGADIFRGGAGTDTATDFNSGEGDTQSAIP